MRQPLSPPTSNAPLIRASELAQYGFCRRAWWLGTVKGIRPSNQAALTGGTQYHTRHAGKVRAAVRWRYLGLVSLGAGSFLLVIAALFSVF
jgi:hypothetical protein